MSDYRGRLIDTAARAITDARLNDRAPDNVRADFIEQARPWAEAVIDALGIDPTNEGLIWQGIDRSTYYVACLEPPAIQTHDYSSDHETRHGL